MAYLLKAFLVRRQCNFVKHRKKISALNASLHPISFPATQTLIFSGRRCYGWSSGSNAGGGGRLKIGTCAEWMHQRNGRLLISRQLNETSRRFASSTNKSSLMFLIETYVRDLRSLELLETDQNQSELERWSPPGVSASPFDWMNTTYDWRIPTVLKNSCNL